MIVKDPKQLDDIWKSLKKIEKITKKIKEIAKSFSPYLPIAFQKVIEKVDKKNKKLKNKLMELDKLLRNDHITKEEYNILRKKIIETHPV